MIQNGGGNDSGTKKGNDSANRNTSKTRKSGGTAD